MNRNKFAYVISTLALLSAAASATAQATANGQTVSEIVVTGTRLKTGFTTATPVTTMSVEQLRTAAPNSVGDALAQLPEFTGSQTTSNLGAVSSVFGGAQALLNLRGMGANRTLVLLDGERLPASNVNGSVDVNVIPQALLSRVDVVTGGASSTYGSDAVAGVVNFILNTHFEGVQLNVDGGQTTYGDASNEHVTIAAGHAFMGGRLRIEGSAEYFNQTGIGLGPNGRSWYDTPAGFVTLPAGSANLVGVIPDVRFSTMAYGGLITKLTPTAGHVVGAAGTAGLLGMQFGANGALQTFDPGTNHGAAFQTGGSGPVAVNGLSPAQDRKSVFLHGEYDATDKLTFFGEFMYERSYTDGVGSYPFEPTTKAFTIYANNAYLPASVAALMAANNIASFNLGRYSSDLPPIENRDTTTLLRFNGGVRGRMSDRWSFDASAAYAVSEQDFRERNTINRNLYAAADAVINPATGAIVCNSTLAGLDPGFVPLNVLGVGAASSAAGAYVTGFDDGDTTDRQVALNVNLRGDLGEHFNLGAGPISIAFGGAYRRDSAVRTVSPLSPIINSCTGLRPTGCTAYNNVYGGYQTYDPGPLNGVIGVGEGYAEVGLPLLKDIPLIRSLDVDLAGRITDYSTSGVTYTWKVGPTWRINDEFRIRATRSQDIRAPSFNELFSTVSSSSTVNSIVYPVSTAGVNATTGLLAVGNRNLQPEVAQTFTVGGVYQPSWIHGLSVSLDYYDINIKGAIATPPGQSIVDGCYAGNQTLCSLMTVGGNPVTTTVGITAATPGVVVQLKPVNIANVKTSGLDAEAAYSTAAFDGRLNTRAVFNYNLTFSNSAAVFPNGPQIIGALGLNGLALPNGTGLPRYTLNLMESYEHPIGETRSIALSFQERIIAPGAINPNYSAAQFDPSQNHVPGVVYTDMTASYKFKLLGGKQELFVTFQNLFNVSPPVDPSATTFQQSTNYEIYDVLGRRWEVGLRARF